MSACQYEAEKPDKIMEFLKAHKLDCSRADDGREAIEVVLPRALEGQPLPPWLPNLPPGLQPETLPARAVAHIRPGDWVVAKGDGVEFLSADAYAKAGFPASTETHAEEKPETETHETHEKEAHPQGPSRTHRTARH